MLERLIGAGEFREGTELGKRWKDWVPLPQGEEGLGSFTPAALLVPQQQPFLCYSTGGCWQNFGLGCPFTIISAGKNEKRLSQVERKKRVAGIWN